jgi:hypothetical protein
MVMIRDEKWCNRARVGADLEDLMVEITKMVVVFSGGRRCDGYGRINSRRLGLRGKRK